MRRGGLDRGNKRVSFGLDRNKEGVEERGMGGEIRKREGGRGEGGKKGEGGGKSGGGGRGGGGRA